FNSKGNVRDNFKTFMFNQVFELQKFDDFSLAFEFISECLVPYQERFYVIPGKQVEEISVDIELSPNENGENIVLGVYFEGDNILKVDERYSIPSEDGETLYEPIRYGAFAKKVSEQMVVP